MNVKEHRAIHNALDILEAAHIEHGIDYFHTSKFTFAVQPLNLNRNDIGEIIFNEHKPPLDFKETSDILDKVALEMIAKNNPCKHAGTSTEIFLSNPPKMYCTDCGEFFLINQPKE